MKILSLLLIILVLGLVVLSSYKVITDSFKIKSNFQEISDFINCRDKKVADETKKVIIRIDNVQAYAFKEANMKMTEDAIKNGIKPVLGVIPKDLKSDPETSKFLEDKKCFLEIALQSLNLKKEDIKKDKHALDKISASPVKTFLAKDDRANDELIKDLNSLNFIYLSQINTKDYLSISSETYDLKDKIFLPVETILENCKKNLDSKNLCIISFHPQSYLKNGTLDPETYQYYY